MPDTISHYEILEQLGEGGTGVVYRARDLRLQRYVALKFLRADIGADDVERERFLQEARAASALDHPNICTIHDIEKAPDGRTAIVMACYEGETLRARIGRGPLPMREAIDIARQIATGLARAHERGLVHGDVKPVNIFLTSDGTVKVLEFGMARLRSGEPVDRHDDIAAVGAILSEMLSGNMPPALVKIVERTLKTRPDNRFANARDLAEALSRVETHPADGASPPRGVLRQPAVAISLALAICVLAVVIGRLWFTSTRASWARNRALPAITTMAAEQRFAEAMALATQAERYLPGDPLLAKLWTDISVLATIDSNPPGALVEVRPYGNSSAAWHVLGTTPLRNVRVARGAQRFRFTRAESEPVERELMVAAGDIHVDLPPAGRR
jgi:tRNA A-37 threonylcarbamoyl transferase component Bud32